MKSFCKYQPSYKCMGRFNERSECQYFKYKDSDCVYLDDDSFDCNNAEARENIPREDI